MVNANLQIQIANAVVGYNEGLHTLLDLDRSAYRMTVDQALNANSAAGVASGTDMTFIGGSASNWAASNRLFHIRHIFLANYNISGPARIDLYDNSVGGVNTMASFRLLSWPVTPLYQIEFFDIQGLIFSTGFAVAQSTNSNTVIMMGGVLRPKMGFELQSTLTPLP